MGEIYGGNKYKYNIFTIVLHLCPLCSAFILFSKRFWFRPTVLPYISSVSFGKITLTYIYLALSLIGYFNFFNWFSLDFG